MVVTKTELTKTEKNQEVTDIEQKKINVVNAALSSMDFPKPEDDKSNKHADKDKDADKSTDELTPEEQERVSLDARAEELGLEKGLPKEDIDDVEEFLKELDTRAEKAGLEKGSSIDEVESAEKEKGIKQKEGDEELIPKSKVEKIQAKLEKRINDLVKQINQAKSDDGIDKDQEALNRKSPSDLRELKIKTKRMIRQEEDSDKIDSLEELVIKIDDAIRTAPDRAKKKSEELYMEAAAEIMEDDEIPNIQDEAVQVEIKKIAGNIYARHGLSKLDNGMATALRMAADHYKVLGTTKSAVKGTDDKSQRIRRIVAKMKRTTNISNSRRKGKTGDQVSLKKIKEEALVDKASSSSKLQYVKTDPRFGLDRLIPDEFKENK